jgi:hypothetical protein
MLIMSGCTNQGIRRIKKVDLSQNSGKLKITCDHPFILCHRKSESNLNFLFIPLFSFTSFISSFLLSPVSCHPFSLTSLTLSPLHYCTNPPFPLIKSSPNPLPHFSSPLPSGSVWHSMK